MQDQTITITIDEQGHSTLDLEGFAGRSCENVFEDFRGSDTLKIERKKASYYTGQQVHQEKSKH
jgi:hypothetical protein